MSKKTSRKSNLPQNLRNWKFQNNITNDQAAERLRVPVRTFADWLYGTHLPWPCREAEIIARLK
jgi:hypothetical protein